MSALTVVLTIFGTFLFVVLFIAIPLLLARGGDEAAEANKLAWDTLASKANGRFSQFGPDGGSVLVVNLDGLVIAYEFRESPEARRGRRPSRPTIRMTLRIANGARFDRNAAYRVGSAAKPFESGLLDARHHVFFGDGDAELELRIVNVRLGPAAAERLIHNVAAAARPPASGVGS